MVRDFPVEGVNAYKPPNSDAGGDLYIMDFIGMFGIPLVPVSKYPEASSVIFLPTQAATDTEIIGKIKVSLQNGSRIIVTSGFLASVLDGKELSELAGVEVPEISKSMEAPDIIIDNQSMELELPLEIETSLIPTTAEVLLEAMVEKDRIPYLTGNKEKNIFVLNAHTFSQADFDAVGEVLLCPRQLGLLNLPETWANTIREVFNAPLNIHLEAPAKVSMQTLANGDIIIHNYNDEKIEARLKAGEGMYFDRITDKDLSNDNGMTILNMAPRSRIWLKTR
jgi:hypothetical protein